MKIFCIIFLVFISMSESKSADKYTKSMQQFLDATFPGQRYVPTGFGADSRFSPKSLWIEASNADKGWRGNNGKGWYAFSSGKAIYPDELVPIYSEEIVTGEWKADSDKGLALALALSGKINELESSADLDVAFSKALSTNIKIGEARVEYGYYYDFLMARSINDFSFKQMQKVLTDRFPKKIPKMKVITNALAVKDSTITVTIDRDKSVGIGGKITGLLDKLGFKWKNKKKTIATLETKGKGWKYIAFKALIYKPGYQISKNSGDQGILEELELDSSPNSNLPWMPIPEEIVTGQ